MSEIVVGYVGRIAPEKQVERLRALRSLPGIALAVVGDGPARPAVEDQLRGMPVTWLGALRGAQGRKVRSVPDSLSFAALNPMATMPSSRTCQGPAAGSRLVRVVAGTVI